MTAMAAQRAGEQASVPQRPHPHTREEPLAGRAEARMEGDRRDAETGRGQDAVGGDPRREVEQAVDQQGEHATQGPEPHANAERIVPAGPLGLASADRAAGATQEVGAEEIPGGPPDQDQHEHGPDDPELQDQLEQIVVGEVVVDMGGIEHRRLVAQVDVMIGAESHAQQRERPEHGQAAHGLDPATRIVGVPDPLEERLEADPGGVGPRRDQEGRDYRQAPTNPVQSPEQREEDEARDQPAHHGAAAQREDHGHRHRDHREHRQVATDGVLPSGGGAEQVPERERPLRGPAARQQIPDAEEDQHHEPGGEVVGVDEGRRDPPGGRRGPPAKQPGLAREVVQQREECQEPAQGQEGAQQAVELWARADLMDHQDVGAHVGQEEQEGPDRMGRGQRAQGEHERRQVRGAGEIPGRGQRPGRHRVVAQGQLDEDEGNQQGQRPIDGRAPPRQLALGHHPQQPAQQPTQHQELGDGQRPGVARAGGQRSPEEECVETGATETV